ncbi:unnamed protein product, partial [Pylaiella littoralis]
MPEGSDAGVGNNELAQQLIAMLEAQQKAQQEVMAKLTERIESLEIRSPARTAEVVQQGESPGSGEAAPGVQQGRHAGAPLRVLAPPPSAVGSTEPLRVGQSRGEVDEYGDVGWSGVESSSTRLIRTAPPSFKGDRANFSGWEFDFMRYSGSVDLLEYFFHDGDFPDTTKTKSQLRQDGFSQ